MKFKFTHKKLYEATDKQDKQSKRDWMSRAERDLKTDLIALLKDDGKGHKHAQFAERLADFDIKVIYYNEADPSTYEFTAAISFDDGIIYISEGFLRDKSLRFQLNVLLRHELAHNLMMHQIRMMHKITDKYGEEGYTHISMSQSIHELLNIIEDFEISNERYTESDKEIVRNMILNGKLIPGLVTEYYREAWVELPVQDMYEALLKEISKQHKNILAAFEEDDAKTLNGLSNDYLNRHYIKTYTYVNIDGHSQLSIPLDKFLTSKVYEHFSDLMQATSKAIINEYTKNTYTDINFFDNLLKEIAKTMPTEKYVLKDANGRKVTVLYTPEEKMLAVELLKALKDEITAYDDWRKAVMDALGTDEYTEDQVKQILDAVEKSGN